MPETQEEPREEPKKVTCDSCGQEYDIEEVDTKFIVHDEDGLALIQAWCSACVDNQDYSQKFE